MRKILTFLENILIKMFPQRQPEQKTFEKRNYEKNKLLSGIKGDKDKTKLVEAMTRRNMGT